MTRTTIAVTVWSVLACSACVDEAPRYLADSAVLITIDTLRADRLSSYGYEEAEQPAIDRLAAEGALFETAYCDIPFTTGSMASTMTGTFGPRHGVQIATQRLRDDAVTVAEVLRDHGFATAAVVGSFPLARVYGLAQGFDRYDDRLTMPMLVGGNAGEHVAMAVSEDGSEVEFDVREKRRADAYRSDGEVTDAAIRWLASRPPGRFFLWVHYFGPHERLYAYGHDQARRIVDDYDDDLARTAAAVGRLLRALDARVDPARTLVVLHSDHGQSLGENGIVGHGMDLYEASVRIPLILRLPSVAEPGSRIEATARNVDLFPTILEAVGVAVPTELNGGSLIPVLRDRDAERDAPAYMDLVRARGLPVSVGGSEYFASVSWRGVRRGRWKLLERNLEPSCIRAPDRVDLDVVRINPSLAVGGEALSDDECRSIASSTLHDLSDRVAEDAESEDVSRGHPEISRDLRAYVEDVARHRAATDPAPLDETDRERLRALGYLN